MFATTWLAALLFLLPPTADWRYSPLTFTLCPTRFRVVRDPVGVLPSAKQDLFQTMITSVSFVESLMPKCPRRLLVIKVSCYLSITYEIK